MFLPYTPAMNMFANISVDVYKMDGVIRSFGMPNDPFSLQELVGYEISIEIGK